MRKRIVLAHGGGDAAHPHSTPFAFAASLAEGADVLDLDVHLTSDGVLVVHHDDDVDRTTNGTGAVASMTYAELHALDDAYWFAADCTCRERPAQAYVLRGVRTGERPPPAGYRPDDFAITRFEDIAARFPSTPMNIEIKGRADDGSGVATARALADALAATGRLDSTVVTSFDDARIEAFHGFAPTVALSPGLKATTAYVLSATAPPSGMTILQLPPEFNGVTVITPELIARTKAAGLVIWVWPNQANRETRALYDSLWAMGLEGINAATPADAVAARAAAGGGG